MKRAVLLISLLSIGQPVRAQGLLDFQKDARSSRVDMYMSDVARGVALTLQEWNEAWADGDARRLSRVYEKDATLYLHDEVLQGRDAIRGHYAELLPEVAELGLLPGELDASGDLAYRVVTVRFRPVTPGGTVELGRRDLFIFRKQWNEEWRIDAHFAGVEEPLGSAD